jgi:hypothetical protein
VVHFYFWYADINGAVEDLASLHEENYIKFCINQLNKWLQPKGLQPGLLEDTCDLTRLLQNYQKVDDSDEDDLLRNKNSNSFSKNVNVFMILWSICNSMQFKGSHFKSLADIQSSVMTVLKGLLVNMSSSVCRHGRGAILFV